MAGKDNFYLPYCEIANLNQVEKVKGLLTFHEMQFGRSDHAKSITSKIQNPLKLIWWHIF